MQNRIGRRQNPLGLYLTSRRTKEGQELGSASAHILVWLSGWLARWVPGFSWVGNRLIGTSLILAPQREACCLRLLIGKFDQGLFFLGFGIMHGHCSRLAFAYSYAGRTPGA